MKRLFSLLRSRRGETLVEVLLSMVLFLMVMAVLSGATRFAAGAQAKAKAIQSHAEQVQQNLRTGTNVTRTPAGQETFNFKAISKDGKKEGDDITFTVQAGKVQLTVDGGENGEDVVFDLFRSTLGGSP